MSSVCRLPVCDTCLGVKERRLIWLLINLPLLQHQNVLRSQQPGPNPFLSECNWCHSNFSRKCLSWGTRCEVFPLFVWAKVSWRVFVRWKVNWFPQDGFVGGRNRVSRLPGAVCGEITPLCDSTHALILLWQWFLAQLNLNLMTVQRWQGGRTNVRWYHCTGCWHRTHRPPLAWVIPLSDDRWRAFVNPNALTLQTLCHAWQEQDGSWIVYGEGIRSGGQLAPPVAPPWRLMAAPWVYIPFNTFILPPHAFSCCLIHLYDCLQTLQHGRSHLSDSWQWLFARCLHLGFRRNK